MHAKMSQNRLTKLQDQNKQLKLRVVKLEKQKIQMNEKVAILEHKVALLLEKNHVEVPMMDVGKPKDQLVLDEECFNRELFKVNDHIAQSKSQDKNVQLLLKRVGKVQDSVLRFDLKVVKSERCIIHIGVVDRTRQKEMESSVSSGNAICYGGWGLINYVDGKWKTRKEGCGFSQKETITTEVNFKTGSISWSVDGKRRAGMDLPLLTHKDRHFVPYFEVFDKGDTIQWF